MPRRRYDPKSDPDIWDVPYMMEMCVAHRVEISAIARAFKVTERVLYDRCMRAFGLSPMQLYVQIRLDEVTRRLRETDETVSVIAESCGWTSGSGFRAIFYNRFGMSAREYRQLYRL